MSGIVTIGFTGTKQGTTEAQRERLSDVIDEAARDHDAMVAHHGMCKGADINFHVLVRLDYPDAVIHGWPGVNREGRSPTRGDCQVDVLHPEMWYIDRDEEIVREVLEANGSGLMIACPRGHVEEQRSGTWTTVRRARDAGVELLLVFPDGMVQQERHGAVILW